MPSSTSGHPRRRRAWFDPLSHRYYLPDGSRCLSVTEILVRSGSVSTLWYTEDSRWRGTVVHEASIRVARGEAMRVLLEHTAGIAPSHRPYIEAYVRFEIDIRPQWTAIEEPLFMPLHHVAGTPDRVGQVRGKRAILDIKTGPPSPWHAAQLGGYRWLLHEDAELWVLYLRPSGDYRLVRIDPMRAAFDWGNAFAAVFGPA